MNFQIYIIIVIIIAAVRCGAVQDRSAIAVVAGTSGFASPRVLEVPEQSYVNQKAHIAQMPPCPYSLLSK